ncbi:DNA replication checkpoint protein tel2 [Phlyctema vagabunda]|uniref:DNA replication checkpoint protein tel2 n=1 Tax=Phlyctema vagabunda TaxID=108571 RepID=A0ABR4P745_9HELO
MGTRSPVSIAYKSEEPQNEHDLIVAKQPVLEKTHGKAVVISTTDTALDIIRSEPDIDELSSALKFLCSQETGYVITTPGPQVAQLVQILVTDVLPNFWTALQESHSAGGGRTIAEELLLRCLRSVPGLSAILHRMKELMQLSKESKKSIGGAGIPENLTILLQALTTLLEGNRSIDLIYRTVSYPDSQGKRKILWSELLSIVGSGKIIGLSAEAEHTITGITSKLEKPFWLANGNLYSSWLGRNIAYMITILPLNLEEGWTDCAELLGRAFRLGHGELVSKEILISTLLRSHDYSEQLSKMISSLPNSEQKNFLQNALRFVSKNQLPAVTISEDDINWWKADTAAVSAAVNMVGKIIFEKPAMHQHLIAWLTSSSGAGVGDGIAIRRATIAALSNDKDALTAVLERSLQQFGDQLYIRHTPILQQEVHTQVLLLCAGYADRKMPLKLRLLMRSGAHLGSVSNRLATSSPRARFLGMVVGEALSSLIDEGDKRMDFHMEELSTAEAKWYKNLVYVSDVVGPLESFRLRNSSEPSKQPKSTPKASSSKANIGASQNRSKIISIEEVEDFEEDETADDENGGFTPYLKPDSDLEDSDEDPTLITRNKPTSPVYIRDLIVQLRDNDSYDRQKIALATGPSLIRRKADFGTEVSSHVEELATLLVGLQDKFELENFSEMRLQCMIAVLVAQPKKMGQWFAKTFFDGDYSLSQRASILTTIGLSARELGGFDSHEIETVPKKGIPSSFPSKALPANMHSIYASPPETFASALHSLSTDLSQLMITPLATKLADKVTGPDILKVRTFSSRLSVESKRKKATTNTLASLVSTSFFFPLTGRFFIQLRAYGSSRQNVVFQPHLLSLYVKTLALLLHFSGPSTLSLPQMTSEFWELLLGLRMQAFGDNLVTEAILFALLTILEINEDKRSLVDAHGRELLEAQRWVEGVFSKLDGGGSEEDEKVRMLAAAVLMRIGECVEKYQALLLGDIASFQG